MLYNSKYVKSFEIQLIVLGVSNGNIGVQILHLPAIELAKEKKEKKKKNSKLDLIFLIQALVSRSAPNTPQQVSFYVLFFFFNFLLY